MACAEGRAGAARQKTQQSIVRIEGNRMSTHGTESSTPSPHPRVEKPESVEYEDLTFNSEEHGIGWQLVRETLGLGS